MEGNASELTRVESGGSENKCHLIGADDTMGLSLTVAEIESKRPEHTHVLIGPEVLKTKARIPVCGQSGYAGEREPGRSVEGEISAVQLRGKTSIHHDADRDLIESRVNNGDCANRTRDSQVVGA